MTRGWNVVRRKWLTLFLFSVCTATCRIAIADSSDVDSSQGAGQTGTAKTSQGALEEIVVTAQKRTEDLEQTPISITAITGETLEREGITDLNSVLQQTPGVTFRSFGPGQNELIIRGIAPTGGNSPTVGFYLDETPLTAPAASQAGKVVIDPDMYDLQRVEVLRGPQPTLYGAGSMGGTVRLITNPPDLTQFSATTLESGSKTQDGGWNGAANLALNIPLIQDTLAVRLVGTYSYDSGWLSRTVVDPFPLETNPSCPGFYGCTRGNVIGGNVTANHQDVNDLSATLGRVSILYKPIDNLSIDATALSQKETTGGFFTFDSVPGTAAHYEPFDIPEPTSDQINLFSLLVKFQLGQFEFTSATARWYRTLAMTQDSSEVVQDLLQTPTFGSSSIYEEDKSDQFSEEFRVATTGSGPLTGLIGAFFSKLDSSEYDNWTGPGYVPVLGTGLLVWFYQPTRIDQHAFFGEGTYQITPQLSVTTGVRWYKYTNSIMTTQYGALDGGPTPVVNNTGAADSGWNPKLTLSYTANDNAFYYATVGKGFRPGAGNFFIPTSGPDSCAPALAALGLTSAPSQYQPDVLWNYEIGSKWQLFNRTVTINAAAYYDSWQGVQQQVPLSCGYVFTANSGNAAVYGGELEIAARATPELTVALSGGYTHAALVENTPSTGGVEGEQLQNVPKATISGRLQYTIPISAHFSLDSQLSGDYVGPRDDYLGPIPSYFLAKLRVGLRGDRLATYFYVNNLTNRDVSLSNATSLSANIPSYNRIATSMPRTFGIDFSYNFGPIRP